MRQSFAVLVRVKPKQDVSRSGCFFVASMNAIFCCICAPLPQIMFAIEEARQGGKGKQSAYSYKKVAKA